MLPKYFKNLHILISCITGTPRIVNIDLEKTNCSDKYKDISKEEWESAMINYFSYFDNNMRQLMITEDWAFYVGGKAENKDQLIKLLEGTIAEIKDLKE